MELDAFEDKFLVADAHDDAGFRRGGDFKDVRDRFGLDGEGVVAHSLEVLWQPFEDAAVVMVDGAHLAVPDLAGAGHCTAERLADALMAQADAEDRQLASEASNCLDAYACLFRCAGSR